MLSWKNGNDDYTIPRNYYYAKRVSELLAVVEVKGKLFHGHGSSCPYDYVSGMGRLLLGIPPQLPEMRQICHEEFPKTH